MTQSGNHFDDILITQSNPLATDSIVAIRSIRPVGRFWGLGGKMHLKGERYFYYMFKTNLGALLPNDPVATGLKSIQNVCLKIDSHLISLFRSLSNIVKITLAHVWHLWVVITDEKIISNNFSCIYLTQINDRYYHCNQLFETSATSHAANYPLGWKFSSLPCSAWFQSCNIMKVV